VLSQRFSAQFGRLQGLKPLSSYRPYVRAESPDPLKRNARNLRDATLEEEAAVAGTGLMDCMAFSEDFPVAHLLYSQPVFWQTVYGKGVER
jgi:hypothetical protein